MSYRQSHVVFNTVSLGLRGMTLGNVRYGNGNPMFHGVTFRHR